MYIRYLEAAGAAFGAHDVLKAACVGSNICMEASRTGSGARPGEYYDDDIQDVCGDDMQDVIDDVAEELRLGACLGEGDEGDEDEDDTIGAGRTNVVLY